MNEFKECPCYIDRPLHRYDKACLVQSQKFSDQQTEEKPILKCDEITNCPIKHLKTELHFKVEFIQEQREMIDLQAEEIRIYKQCQGKRASKREEELKQENEHLRSDNSMLLAQGDANAFVVSNLNFKIQKLQQCIDEIEEIVNYGSVSYNNHKELADFYEDKIEEIIKLIKQIKGCEE